MHLLAAIKGIGFKNLKRYLTSKDVRMLKREGRYFVQRLVRGWDDSETFSLDVSLAELILPRLRRFREITIATPIGADEQEWADDLDKMIKAFEFICTDEYYSATEKQGALVNEGLQLFANHYMGLWW